MRRLTPKPHQLEMADVGYSILKDKALAYNISEARTGKSLTSILIAHKMYQSLHSQGKITGADKLACLIITKKAAIPDWVTLVTADYVIEDIVYHVCNYESVHKIPSDFKPHLAVLDESHALGGYPKPGAVMIKVADAVWGLPLLYVSMTPHAESYAQIYHQLRLSPWSPFCAYGNFYDWHRYYGIPATRYMGSRSVPMYNEIKEDVVKPIFDSICFGVTRSQAGFHQEAVDVTHHVKLADSTVGLLKELDSHRCAVIQGLEVVVESPMSLFQKKYQLEGGTLKVQVGVKATGKVKIQMVKGVKVEVPVLKPVYKSMFIEGELSKIQYILENWGDEPSVVIMYHYQEEYNLLKTHFHRALILQADKYAEGISLKEYKHLIIYSMSFRTSKYIQRRDRQNDFSRKEPINVHYILVEGGISSDVYDAVVGKNENFNKRVYELQHGKLGGDWMVKDWSII